MSLPYIVKYAPRDLSDVVGRDSEIVFFSSLINSYKRGSKPIFLYGGFGSGKTSLVYAFANTHGFEVVEVNASDVRKASAIDELLGRAINQGSLFGNSKIILVDEAEGLSGIYDRGAIPAILKLQEKSSFPIVFVANDAYNQKLKEIRKKSELIEFEPLNIDEIKSILQKIIDKEQIICDDKALNHIARISGGDIRSAVNDLQNLGKNISLDDALSLSQRDIEVSIEDALRIIFKTKSPEVASRALDDVDVDLDKIFLWVEENLPKEYLRIEDLSKGLDNLALADVFFGRIRRWQYYRFYVYCYALVTAGISLSKKDKYSHSVKFEPSSRLLKIWIANRANMKRKSIAQKYAQKAHLSSKQAYMEMNFLSKVFVSDKTIQDHLELNKEEIDWLKK